MKDTTDLTRRERRQTIALLKSEPDWLSEGLNRLGWPTDIEQLDDTQLSDLRFAQRVRHDPELREVMLSYEQF